MARLTQAELERYVLDEVLAAAAATGAEVRELAPDEVVRLRTRAGAALGADPRAPIGFDNLADSASVQDEDAWRRLPELLTAGPHELFWDHSHDAAGVRVADGSRLTDLLAECFGFPFYVVDADLTLVVGMDDHDVLVGAGRAAGWVRSLGAGG